MSQQSQRRLSNSGFKPAKSSDPAYLVGKVSPPQGSPRHWWTTPAICLFLAVIVWVVFGQTMHYEFINYDDDRFVYENPTVTAGLTLKGIASSFSYANSDNLIPLTSISHMVDWQLYGRNAGGHHLTNVLLHAANAILLFLVLGVMTGTVWRSAFVAAVFAVHPLHVESVAWVAERKDVLSGLFFMLTLWAYARYAKQGGGWRPKSRFWYGLALACFTFGLMSKPMLVTLPFVLLLLDYWPLKRMESLGSGFRVRSLILEKVPFLLLAAADCVATILLQSQNYTIVSVQHLGFFWRAGNALVAYADYIWQMIYPAGLAVLYLHLGNHLPVWKMVVSASALIVISAGVVAWRRRYPYLLAGWLWYLGMLVPVIGLVQVGVQARADRYTYLPQIGLYILLTWGAVELCRSWRHQRAGLGAAAAVILAGLMAGAYVQTGYWKNSIPLWSHTLACTSENLMAHYNFGYALAGQGRMTEAIEQYKQALQINPDLAQPHNAWGNALVNQGKMSDAIEQYRQALQINPDLADASYNWGVTLARQGKANEAVEHFERALQINPDSANAHFEFGNALNTLGKAAEAMEHFERAVQINPDFAEAHDSLGNSLAREGKWIEAIKHYEQAVQIKPDFASAHANLGVALAGQGKLDEAIAHFNRAIQIKPDFANARYNLACALAKKGNLTEATTQFRQSLELAVAQNNATLAKAIRAWLDAHPPALPQPQSP